MVRLMSRAWTQYLDFMGALVTSLSGLSGVLGACTARRPKLVMAIAASVSILACLGWLNIHSENRSDHLWCAALVALLFFSSAARCLSQPTLWY